MRNSRLLQLLSLLDKNTTPSGNIRSNSDEIKRFRNWLASPWANNSSRLVDLYNILMEHYPEFPSSVIAKPMVFKKLYPGKPYNDRLMRNHMGELAQQLDNYFLHTHIQNNPKAKSEVLIEAYFERNYVEPAIKLTQHKLEQFEQKQAKGADDYLNAFYLEKKVLQHPAFRTKRLTEKNVAHGLDEKLDAYYAIQKIKFIADKKDRQNFIDGESTNIYDDLEQLKNLLSEKDHPLLTIYEILLNDGLNDQDRFELAKNKFFEYSDYLSKEDQKVILVRLQNIMINRYAKGDETAIKEIFELGRFGIDRRILDNRGKITDRTFINIVTTGNQSGAFKYVRKFITTYYQKIDPKLTDDIKNWADAHYELYRGKPERCLRIINNCTIKHHIISISVRTLELMARFELLTNKDEASKVLVTRLKLFQRNLYRDSILAENRKASYLKFVSYLGKMITVYSKYFQGRDVSGKSSKLVVALEKEDNVQLKFWLLNHLKKLREDSQAIPPKVV